MSHLFDSSAQFLQRHSKNIEEIINLEKKNY